MPHPSTTERPERLDTVADVITLVRTTIAVVLAVLAITQTSWALLVAAYGVYWVGDVLDGRAARALDQETRAGAVFDIVSDRACTTLCAAALVLLVPQALVPVTIFLVQFCVVDTMLSLSFLGFRVISPNYFAEVDPTIYRLNWSPAAKALNTSAVVLLCLVGQTALATACALLVLAVKCWSSWRLATVVWPQRAVPARALVAAP